MRRRTTTARAALVLGLVLGLTLTACGGGDDDATSAGETSTPTTADVAVPTEDELAATLLTAADVPAGFTQSPAAGDDEGSFAGTCLADVGTFSDALGSEPDEKAEVEFVSETASSQASVSSQVEAYADPAAVAPVFARFTESLQTCTSVDTTDATGVTYAFAIAYDDTVDLPGADDQLAFDVTGTIGAQGQSLPVAFRFVVALAGPFVSVVSAYALGDDASGVVDAAHDLATIQADRVDQLG